MADITQVYTKRDAHNEITEQFKLFRRIGTDRRSRIDFSICLTEQYLALNDKIPPTSVLDRLATLILQDEISDKNIHKSLHNEYPILSDRQQERRHCTECSIKAAQDVATDGIDYRVKTRDSNRRMREHFG